MQSTGTGNRPNRIGDGLAADPTIAQWFDPSAFVSPTDLTGTYGDSGRGILRGPGQFNIDFSVIKGTKIGKIDTEFRVEAFNVLNHPQFGQPEHDVRQRGLRPDHGDARQPVVRPLRHHGAEHPDRVQGEVLIDRRLASRPAATPLA